MPLLGKVAIGAFVAVASALAFMAASWRTDLQGLAPAPRWFVWFVSTLACLFVFGLCTSFHWPFFLIGGLVWGSIFSAVNTFVLWRAFDEPSLDYGEQQNKLLETDLGELGLGLLRSLLAFRPIPELAATGLVPWLIFCGVILLSMAWSLAFCVLVALTEGPNAIAPPPR